MEREASKLFPWRCNVCAQNEFLDKTGRYKTEGKLGDILYGYEGSIQDSVLCQAVDLLKRLRKRNWSIKKTALW